MKGCDFACTYTPSLVNKVPKIELEIIVDALNMKSLSRSLPVSLIGMNAGLMTQYLEFVADRLLVELGCDRDTANPFDFMDMISLQGKTNFFEKKLLNTKKAGVMNTDEEAQKITFDADFLSVLTIPITFLAPMEGKILLVLIFSGLEDGNTTGLAPKIKKLNFNQNQYPTIVVAATKVVVVMLANNQQITKNSEGIFCF
jgi:hypothetical protein